MVNNDTGGGVTDLMGELSLSMGRAVYPWMDPVWA